MAKRILYIKTEADKANYEFKEPYKTLKDVHIYIPATNIWHQIYQTKLRNDRPTFSIRGNELILDPPPDRAYLVQVTVDA